jgi:hypothetical protein
MVKKTTTVKTTTPVKAVPTKVAKNSGKKPRASKKAKDPNAPKKPLSAYMFFATENRPAIKAENPSFTFGELAKAVSDKWNAMSDEDKKPYTDKATADKARYAKEKAAYTPAPPAPAAPATPAVDEGMVEHFASFLRVQKSGVTNMFDKRKVMELANITEDQYRYIANEDNYKMLSTENPELYRSIMGRDW